MHEISSHFYSQRQDLCSRPDKTNQNKNKCIFWIRTSINIKSTRIHIRMQLALYGQVHLQKQKNWCCIIATDTLRTPLLSSSAELVPGPPCEWHWTVLFTVPCFAVWPRFYTAFHSIWLRFAPYSLSQPNILECKMIGLLCMTLKDNKNKR
jgi:hypothetical protein